MRGVPYRPQNGAGANYRRNDCGVACIAMLLAYLGRLGARTVDQLTAETGLASSDTGLSCRALVALGARHGLDLFADAFLSVDRLKAEVDAGRPPVALIAYRYVLDRLDQADKQVGNDGHFVVVTGHTDTHIIVNDPDWWAPYTEGGHHFRVPLVQFKAAFAEYLGQAVTINSMSPKEEAAARLNDAQAAVARIQEASTTTSPTATTARALNVRAGPGLTYAIKGQLPVGACVPVVVVPAISATAWYQIVGWDNAFVSADMNYWVTI